MEDIFIILGIGNPGREYQHTRHNLGFRVVDRLAVSHDISMRRRKCHSLFGEGHIENHRVGLLKPQTYVNSSGLAARDAVRLFKVPASHLLVVCDDVNLATGRIRLRRDGSAGGHHGLESIAEKLNTNEFPRLRIGIGRPVDADHQNDVIGHVLSSFDEDEAPLIESAIERSAEAAVTWLREGIEAAMTRFN